MLTVDPSVFGNDELGAYMTLGTKFRPCGVSPTSHEEGMASYIYEQLERYVQKMQQLTKLDRKVFKISNGNATQTRFDFQRLRTEVLEQRTL